MKNLISNSFAMTVLLLLVSCTGGSSQQSLGQPSPAQVSCSLAANWERCSDNDGSSSTRVRLEVVGAALNETIENFNNNADCSGTADDQFQFSATVSLGPAGESTFVEGGTDADLTPDVDLAGCGMGQPMHTVLKFSEDCSQFNVVASGPTCDAANRGGALDPQPFLKAE